MAQNPESYPPNSSSGLAFGLGLVAGAAIGIGFGLLFAPKKGAALRRDVARRARDLRNEAGERLEQVAEAAEDLVDRGRDVAERARSAVTTGIREARRYGAGVAADLADAVKHNEA